MEHCSSVFICYPTSSTVSVYLSAQLRWVNISETTFSTVDTDATDNPEHSARMVFQPPSWVPDITTQIPPNANVAEWALESRRATGSVRAPFICALTGKKYTFKDVREKVNALAKALCNELGWLPNQGTAEEKVIGVLAVNSVRCSELQ